MTSEKRKKRQPEGPLRTVTWVPRRGKWRAGNTGRNIEFERRMSKVLGHTQEQISAQRHFNRAAERLGDDEQREGIWRVHDPLHKLISFHGPEDQLDRTRLLRRLIEIKQLEGMRSSCYGGTSGDRYQHAIGTMHLAGRIARAVGLKHKEREFRLAGLLHDVGHTAFSHGAEEILKKERGIDHEALGEEMMKQAKVPELLSRHGIDFQEVLSLTKGEGLGEIVSEFADRMDYLQRDAMHAGVKDSTRRDLKLTIEAVIRNLRLRNGRIAVTVEGEKALKKFAGYRSQFFTRIYFHPTSMLSRYMLRRALEKGIKMRAISVDDLINKSDYNVALQLHNAGVHEARYLAFSSAHLQFSPVFGATLEDIKLKTAEQREKLKKKIIQALKKAGLQEHEFFVGSTPDVEKQISYRVVRGKKEVEKTYVARSPADHKLFFVFARDDKRSAVAKVVEKFAATILKKGKSQSEVNAPLEIIKGSVH